MPSFLVPAVVDGDTFDVSPRWQWNGQTGDRVWGTRDDAPELHEPGWQAVKTKLERLSYREGR